MHARQPWLLAPLLAFAACVGGPPAHPADTAIEACLAQAAAEDFSGVLAVDRPGSVHIQALGRADRATGAPMRGETVFRFASITKQLTAVLVLQAVAAGRFDLDTKVAALWPDAPIAHSDRITVRHLLTHRSGLPDPEANGPLQDRALAACDHATRVRWLPRTAAAQPGERFAYNNADFWLLGALLERVHGSDYATLLQRDVFTPAGMATAGVYTTAALPPATHAHGHVGVEPAVEPPVLLAAYGAAGAAYGTAADLLRFDRALREGRLLTPEAWRQMTTADAQGAALGVWCYELTFGSERVQVVERQGWIGGVKTLNLISPSHAVAVVVLSNDDRPELASTWKGEGLGAELLRAAVTRP